MKDLLAWFALKRYPFDKNIKTQDVLETEPLKECTARLNYIKRRGGILLLTGDPGVGKTLALRRYVDSLNENLFKTYTHQSLMHSWPGNMDLKFILSWKRIYQAR